MSAPKTERTGKLRNSKAIKPDRWPKSPRQERALVALLSGPRMREDIDHISGASNGPEVVYYLRRGAGLEIPCERVPGADRDGRPCAPGRYKLTPADRAKALQLQRDSKALKMRPATAPKPTPRTRASGPQGKRRGAK